jgi:hypothetical protein
MTVGWSILIVGVLTLLVFNEGFRRVVGWVSVVAVLIVAWNLKDDSSPLGHFINNAIAMVVGLFLFGLFMVACEAAKPTVQRLYKTTRARLGI